MPKAKLLYHEAQGREERSERRCRGLWRFCSEPFSTRLWWYQISFLSGTGASITSDESPSQDDPNPIMDSGCPRSAGKISSALPLFEALRIDFSIHPLDCEPFFHWYGMKCSEAQLVVGFWKLPITNLNGLKAQFLLYHKGLWFSPSRKFYPFKSRCSRTRKSLCNISRGRGISPKVVSSNLYQHCASHWTSPCPFDHRRILYILRVNEGSLLEFLLRLELETPPLTLNKLGLSNSSFIFLLKTGVNLASVQKF